METTIVREEGGGGSWWSDWFSTGFGRMLRGIIKLVLASLIISLTNTIPKLTPNNITVGSTTVPIQEIALIIVAFVPILLIVSALRDFDIRI